MESIGILKIFFERSALGNALWKWPAALLLVLIFILVFTLLEKHVSKRLARLAEERKNSFLGYLAQLLTKTKPFLLFLVSLWAASTMLLALPQTAERFLDIVALLAVFLQVAFWGSAIIGYAVQQKVQQTEDVAQTTGYAAFGLLLKAVVWILVVLVALGSFGIDVSALIAGLGVGGIAVALAVQNILGDLLCSFSILFDKPFEVGDFIIVGDKMGVVERIGIKSTRIKSLSGEQVIIANSDLVSSRIQNYKRMQERRIVFSIGVVYQTSEEKVAAIPKILREVVESRKAVRFDRAHFKAFGPYSLDFEVVYYVLSGDYAHYMDIQQQINFEILRRFTEQGIEFAYPTQTLLVENAVQQISI